MPHDEPDSIDVEVCLAAFAKGVLHRGLLCRVRTSTVKPIRFDGPNGPSQHERKACASEVFIENRN